MKVVLVDEDKETFEVLNELAHLSGSEIIYFDNIDSAKNFFKENPDVDGLVIERYIHNIPSGELISYVKNLKLEIPTILLTSSITEEEKEYFKNLGITEIIEKPFNPLEVMTAIVEYLSKEKGRDYVEERLHAEKVDKASLKLLVEKIINFLKKLFGK